MTTGSSFLRLLFRAVAAAAVLAAACTAPPEQAQAPAEHARTRYTVESLRAGGAVLLSDEEIEGLVVGKTLRIIELKSGAKWDVFFGEDGKQTLVGTLSDAHGGSQHPAAHPFQIHDGHLHSALADGTPVSWDILRLGSQYYGARHDEGGQVNYELIGVVEGRVTTESLEAQGGKALTDDEITQFLVGKTILVRHMVTGEMFELNFGRDGKRTVVSTEMEPEEAGSSFVIRDGKVEIHMDDGTQFSARVYKLHDRYLAARSTEEGFVSYEIISSH